MFKTETHLHVAEVSDCSKLKASEMIKAYHKAGYKTVFVTDHFTACFLDSLGDIPYEDKITVFLSGYYKAKVVGDSLGMNVMMSAEISLESCPNHYLAYGVTKAFLVAYPELCYMSAEELYRVAKKHGIFLVQAHPHRDGVCYPTPEFVDGMEIYNPNPRHEDHSDKTEAVVREYGLCVTGGSDSHRPEDIARSGVETEEEIKTTEDFVAAVKSGRATIIRSEGGRSVF